jgi:hypothetical protein
MLSLDELSSLPLPRRSVGKFGLVKMLSKVKRLDCLLVWRKDQMSEDFQSFIRRRAGDS